MIQHKLDIVSSEVEIYYDPKRDNLADEWEALRRELVNSIKSQIKGCRKQKIIIKYRWIYALLEPHIYFLAFKYFGQIKNNRTGIQKIFFNPELLINDLFLKIFPIKHFLFWNLKLKIQYLIGFILLCACIWFRNNLELLRNLGFMISFYGGLSITILTTMSDEQILSEIIDPVWNERFYIYKNLRGNQKSNFAGILFLAVGFIIQLMVTFLLNDHVTLPISQRYVVKEAIMLKLFVWLLGLLFSVALGHIVIKWLNFGLRKYIEAEEKPAKLTPTIGCLERAIYTILTVFQQYNYVAILFGIKIAQRFIRYTEITNDDELKNASQHANVFIICNIVSLGFGILGGVLILYFTSR